MSKRTYSTELAAGESVSIDHGRVMIKLVEKSGRRARLEFRVDDAVCIEPVRERAVSASEAGTLS